MKFGKRLLREAAQAPAEWRNSFVDYKARFGPLGIASGDNSQRSALAGPALKKLISAGAVGEVGPDRFAQALKEETNKASVLYTQTCAKLSSALDDVEEHLKSLSGDGLSPDAPPEVDAAGRRASGSSNGGQSAQRKASRQLAKGIAPELMALRQFVVVNYTAVVKGVKKWNKNVKTGRRLDATSVLLSETFFTSRALSLLVTRAEMAAVCLAPPRARNWEDFACPVCLDVLRNPVILSCAHRFCFECVATAALYADQTPAGPGEPAHGLRCACPVCRKIQVLDEGALKVDPMLDDFLREHFARDGDEDMLPPVTAGADSPAPEAAGPAAQRAPLGPAVMAYAAGAAAPAVQSALAMQLRQQRELQGLPGPSEQLLQQPRPGPFDGPSTSASAPPPPSSSASSSAAAGGDSGAAFLPRPQPLPRPTAQRVPKLLLIGIDGCRPDALMMSGTPNIDELVFGKGAFSLVGAPASTSARAPPPSPEQSWDLLLTGRLDDGRAAAPSFLSLLHGVRPWVRGTAVASLGPVVSRLRGPECRAAPAPSDDTAMMLAAAALASNAPSDVVVLQLGAVQQAGVRHGFGPHVSEYREAISRTDALIGRLLDAIRERQERNPHEDWLIAVTNTGGGTKREDMPPSLQQAQGVEEYKRGGGGAGKKGEGSSAYATASASAAAQQPQGAFGLPSVPQHENSFLLLAGITVATGEILPVSRLTDLVPTFLTHFGVVPRSEWRLAGRPLACVTGQAGWDRLFAAQQPEAAEARGRRQEAIEAEATTSGRPAAAAAVASAGPRPLTEEPPLTPEAVKAALAGVAQPQAHHGHVPMAFLASVPGLLDPQPMAVVGHRGAGMNAGSRDGSAARENTVASFAIANAQGATWVEMDVQVTSDGVSVVWHDDDLLLQSGDGVRVERYAIRGMTAAKFASVVPPTSGSSATHVPVGGRRTSLLRLFGNAPAGGETPWDCPIDDTLPTLEEAFRRAPPELGFNLELKFVEAKTPGPAEMREILLSILAACERSSNGRRLFFSSFDPDAAVLMRQLQSRWPVMLLTDAAGDPGSAWEVHPDPRRNGIRAAIATALQGGLAGIVTDSAPLFASPGLVQEIRATGLLLATWGSRNTDPAAVRTQAEWGVCALITDAVGRSVEALQVDAEERNGAQARAAAAAASPAPVRGIVAALPPFLGGGGNIPEEIMRQHALKDIQFTNDSDDVRSVFDAAGNVGVRQKPLPEDRQYGEPLTPAEKREKEQQRAAAQAAAAQQAAQAAGSRALQNRLDCECGNGMICHQCVFGAAGLVRPRQGGGGIGGGGGGGAPPSAVPMSAGEASGAAAGSSRGGTVAGGGGGGAPGMSVQAKAPVFSTLGGGAGGAAGASGAAAPGSVAGVPPPVRRPAGGRLGLSQLLQSPRLWMV